ncbi:MAG: tRNA dihydrouridine synthase DusB [Candidatus Woesearchaeota archaeon]
MTNKLPKLNSKSILAPMSGVTDVAFRALAKKYGAGLTYTEFVSSSALVRGSDQSNDMLRTDPNEKPKGVQLFGSSEKEIIKAAKLVEKKFDIIDINCGCPAFKVINTGAGSAMLKNPELIGKLIKKLCSEVNKPITIKIRIGIDDKRINAVKVAMIAEKNGAAAIAVHGRTQEQGYSGKADWDMIKEVKKAVAIPVIGNGDVNSPEVFKQRLDESGVDYIMIGRAAMGNPYIFKQVGDYLKKGEYINKDRLKQFKEYLVLAKKYNIPFKAIKQQAMWFTKGIVGGGKLRLSISKCDDLRNLKNLLKN